MKYATYLATLNECPFCNGIQDRVLAENAGAFLIYSRVPYHKYHLIVSPKRHVENIKDLSWDENVNIMELIVTGIKALDRLGHNDCNVLARDGQALAKTIKHLHYHIIPGGQIVDVSINQEDREFLSKTEEKSIKEELQKSVDRLAVPLETI